MIDPIMEEAAERMYLYMQNLEIRMRELTMTIKTCAMMLDHLTGGKVAEREARRASMLNKIAALNLPGPPPLTREDFQDKIC